MYGDDGVDGFEFENEVVLDQNVDAVAGFQLEVAVDDGQRVLRFGFDAASCKFGEQAGGVGAFEEARA